MDLFGFIPIKYCPDIFFDIKFGFVICHPKFIKRI